MFMIERLYSNNRVWDINNKYKYLYYLVKKGAQDLLLVLWGNVVKTVHQWF